MDDNLSDLKVAILIANGFEQIEMVKPKEALDKAGAKTLIISPEKNVQGWHHFDKGDNFTTDVLLHEAHPDDYDALLLPGGVVNPDILRTLPDAITFTEKINQQGKPIAAICHGPWLLINANVAKGHKLTSWSSIKIDLINAGATWVDEPAVIDNQLLTSRNPNDIPTFNEKMIKLFNEYKKNNYII